MDTSKLPASVAFETFYGFDAAFIYSTDLVQERLDFVARDPAGDPWTRFGFDLVPPGGAAALRYRNGCNADYGKLAINRTQAAKEPLLQLAYQFTETSGTATETVSITALRIKRTPYTRHLERGGSISSALNAALAVVEEPDRWWLCADQKNSVLDTSSEEANDNRQRTNTDAFMDAWMKLPAIPLGFSIPKHDSRASVPIASASHLVSWKLCYAPGGGDLYVKSYFDNRLVWLLNTEKKNPTLPASVDYSAYMSEHDPCVLIYSPASIMLWFLERLAVALDFNLGDVAQDPVKPELTFRIRYEDPRTGTGYIALVKLTTVLNNPGNYCQLKLYVEENGKITKNGPVVALGFNDTVMGDALLPVFHLSTPTVVDKVLFNYVEKQLKSMFNSCNLFFLNCSTRFFFKNLRLANSMLVITSTPKY